MVKIGIEKSMMYSMEVKYMKEQFFLYAFLCKLKEINMNKGSDY